MNLTNMSYIKYNSTKIITVSSLLALMCAIYFAPIGDYLVISLKYLPGFNSEADTTRNPVIFWFKVFLKCCSIQ